MIILFLNLLGADEIDFQKFHKVDQTATQGWRGKSKCAKKFQILQKSYMIRRKITDYRKRSKIV